MYIEDLFYPQQNEDDMNNYVNLNRYFDVIRIFRKYRQGGDGTPPRGIIWMGTWRTLHPR